MYATYAINVWVLLYGGISCNEDLLQKKKLRDLNKYSNGGLGCEFTANCSWTRGYVGSRGLWLPHTLPLAKK